MYIDLWGYPTCKEHLIIERMESEGVVRHNLSTMK